MAKGKKNNRFDQKRIYDFLDEAIDLHMDVQKALAELRRRMAYDAGLHVKLESYNRLSTVESLLNLLVRNMDAFQADDLKWVMPCYGIEYDAMDDDMPF